MTARILVVDDVEANVRLLEAKLTAEYYDVISCADGTTALQMAAEEKPDIILLDVMMPGMDGFEVCRAIREDVSLENTGIIMLTGIGERLNEMTSPLYGADEHLDKPFDLDELTDLMRTVLERRHG